MTYSHCKQTNGKFSPNLNRKRCPFCGEKHKGKKCPIEEKMAPHMRRIVGHFGESIASHLDCPKCGKSKTLRIRRDNTPSNDIYCSDPACTCHPIEVKTKCLSGEIPYDLLLHHGNYFEYTRRQANGLDFIIIIYSVDRLTKKNKIRKVLYQPNKDIIEDSKNTHGNFRVTRKSDSSGSTITIKDRRLLKELTIPSDVPTEYDFSGIVNELVQVIREN